MKEKGEHSQLLEITIKKKPLSNERSSNTVSTERSSNTLSSKQSSNTIKRTKLQHFIMRTKLQHFINWTTLQHFINWKKAPTLYQVNEAPIFYQVNEAPNAASIETEWLYKHCQQLFRPTVLKNRCLKVTKTRPWVPLLRPRLRRRHEHDRPIGMSSHWVQNWKYYYICFRQLFFMCYTCFCF